MIETSDTGPCASLEIPMNDADDDCDGWADEYGAEWTRIGKETVFLRATDNSNLGMEMDAGFDAAGQFWVAAQRNTYFGYQGQVIAGTRDGQRLVVELDYGSMNYLGYPAVLNGEGTAAFLMVGPALFGGSGTQTLTDAVTTVPLDPLIINASGEDVDGDGFDELLSYGGSPPHLIITDGPVATPTWSNLRADITATYPPVQNFAYNVGEAADVTGDGIPEIPTFSEEDGGRVWLIPGDVSGAVDVQDVASAVLHGEDAYDYSGWEPAAGDANGDGYQDLIIGGPLADDRWGKSYLVLGPILDDQMLADADAIVVADWADDYCGLDQDFLDDVDGDGKDEVAVSCPRSPFGSLIRAPGRVQIYRGSDASGTLGVAEAAAVFVGEGPYDLAGYQFQTRDDVDGDGYGDLVIAAPADTSDDELNGTVYLVSGPLLP